ncbi:hypothetical protein [Legionella cardiaca]|uniref:Transmembrane protein n=1 Tax=Legionella cardiaca TaxID=1071983 RepID=A0ABY8ATN0_9GAMM|nr:hypothetical protein [Legionella cardiaca]WED44042.1 hypothetical protein PXX05_04445 [Legionella cardiaca]
MKKEFNHLDQHAQLYLSAYQDQERRHQLFRVGYKVLAILAALIPPLSLIFTIQATVQDSKKDTFNLWSSIGFCILFSLLPIASAFMSWHLIENLEDSRRQDDTIQKVTFSQNDFIERKEYFSQIKNQMKELGVNLTTVKPDSAQKNHKVIIKDIKEDKHVVDVYMDSAQRERQSEMLKYGIVLFGKPNNQELTKEDLAKIYDAPGFFHKKHAESIEIVKHLETQYKM